MEFHGTFGYVELRGDLLVGEALKDAVQHFLLSAAYLHTRAQGTSGSEQFLGALRGSIQKGFPGHHQQFVVFGRLAADQTVHGKQTCNFLDWHVTVRFRLDAEPHGTGGAFAEDETLREEW